MEEIVVCSSDLLSFSNFLKLLSIYEQTIAKRTKEIVDRMNLKLKDMGIESITYSYNKYDGMLHIKCRHFEYKEVFESKIEISVDKIHGYGLAYKRIESILQEIGIYSFLRDTLNAYKNYSFDDRFMIGNEEYILNLDMVKNTDAFFPYNGHFKRVIIKSLLGKTDIFYYDNLQNLWCIKNKEGNFVPIPSDVAMNIVRNLPYINFNRLPDFLKNMIFLDGEIVYQINDSGIWTKETPSLWDSLRGKYKKGYVLKFNAEQEEKNDDSFMDKINGNSNTLPNTNTNTKEIINNIKNILIQLKNNNISLNDSQKIKLTDSIFFERVEGDRKIVADLFRDHDIIKNCNLEKIDFTNADIEGLDLSDTNARIILNCLYNCSIKNANLRNVNLIMQELNGIIADGANLCGTNIYVSLDKTSIKGTKFGSDAVFNINGIPLDLEMVKSMGILVEIKEEKRELTI